MEKDLDLDNLAKVIRLEGNKCVYLEYCRVKSLSDYIVEFNVNNETVVGFIVDSVRDEYIKVFTMDNRGINIGDNSILRYSNFSLKLAIESSSDSTDDYDGTSLKSVLEEQIIILDNLADARKIEEPFWVKLNNNNKRRRYGKRK